VECKNVDLIETDSRMVVSRDGENRGMEEWGEVDHGSKLDEQELIVCYCTVGDHT
jgi:hypothetical protein